MADVVKRSRPRIVVPICVGSNPIIRPIFKRHLIKVFFILADERFSPKFDYSRSRNQTGKSKIDIRNCNVSHSICSTTISVESHHPPHLQKLAPTGAFLLGMTRVLAGSIILCTNHSNSVLKS